MITFFSLSHIQTLALLFNFRRGIFLNLLNLTLMARCDGVLGLGDATLTGGGSGWEWGALTAAAASPPCGHHNKGI